MDVRCRQLASLLKLIRRTEEYTNLRPKILREEGNTTQAILVHVPSTATATEESFEVNNDLLLTENQKERNITCLSIKLKRLKCKQASFLFHKECLTRCFVEEFVPKGPEVTLESTIGNYYQEFLENWYLKQKQFLLSLMKTIL